jgi:ribose 5-phosphate isomerase B
MADRIVLGSDHAGLGLKAEAVRLVEEMGFEVSDLGTTSAESVDYPDFAARVAAEVAAGRARLGILVCGTGIGMSIAANKVRGIRAAHCVTEFDARMARAHNDANVLCIGARVLGPGLASEVVRAFLEQPFEGGRHQRRIDKITGMER